MIVIKQPPMYIEYEPDERFEPYDRTLIRCQCDCNCQGLCERGIGLCDKCIDKITEVMTQDLENII